MECCPRGAGSELQCDSRPARQAPWAGAAGEGPATPVNVAWGGSFLSEIERRPAAWEGCAEVDEIAAQGGARPGGVCVPGSVQSTQVQGSEFKMRAVSAVVAESAESLV